MCDMETYVTSKEYIFPFKNKTAVGFLNPYFLFYVFNALHKPWSIPVKFD